MSAAFFASVPWLAIGLLLLAVSWWRYRRASREFRPLYLWTGAALASLLVFVLAHACTGQWAGGLNVVTFTALFAVLAPAWCSVAAAHYLAARRRSGQHETPAVLIASAGLVVLYAAAGV